MQRFQDLQESYEFRLIVGVTSVIVTSFLIGFGMLTGSELRSHVARLVDPPTTVRPALQLSKRYSLAADLPVEPAWRSLGELNHVHDQSVLTATTSAPPSAPPERLVGRLVLPPGTPADERLVVVATERRPVGGSAASSTRRAEVRADGTFELAVVPGERRVWLSLDARYLRLDGGRRVSLAGRSEDSALVLTPTLGGRITGRFRINGETPPGTRVELANSATGAALRTADVRDGGFEFGGLDTNRPLWLRTIVEHSRADPPQALQLLAGEHHDVSLALASLATARGMAVDAAGQPLAGATVRARPAYQSSGRGDQFATTDTMGRFVLGDLDAGEWILFLDAQRNAERIAVVLESGGEHNGVRLRTRGEASLAATVAWPDGTPAARARAVLVAQDGERREFELDQAGALTVDDLAPGAWDMSLFAERSEAPNQLRVGHLERRIVLPGEGPVTFELGGRGKLRGTVKDAEGRRVERFHLLARSRSGAQFEADFTNGEFQVVGLAAGVWDLSILGDRGLASRLSVPLTKGEERSLSVGSEARKSPTEDSIVQVSLGGQLRLGDQPIAGEVWVQPANGPVVRVETDPYGRFEAGKVLAGAANVRVLLEGFPEPIERALLVPRSEQHRVDLRFATGALEGAVSGLDGATLSGVRVEARAVGALSSISVAATATTVTDAEGRFFLPFLDRGAWQVTIDGSPRGLARTTFAPVTLEGRTEARAYQLGLGATLLGRVEDAEGRGVANATLFGAPGNGSDATLPLGVSTDADGNWTLDGLQLGAWRIVARTSDGRTSPAAEVLLAADERRAVPKLVVETSAGIRVLPTTEAGDPVEAWIELFDQHGRRREDVAVRAGDGTLRFAPLPAGNYWLRATDARGHTVRENIELAEHDRELTLIFP